MRSSLVELFEPDEAAALVARVDEQVAGTCGFVWSPEAGTYRAAQEPEPETAAVSQETLLEEPAS